MTKRCELTGISPLKGHNVSHAKNKTKRRFLPNLKKVTFKSDILKKNIKLNVTNAALRTVDFKGGLDKYLLSAKNAKLSKKVKKLKSILKFRLIIRKNERGLASAQKRGLEESTGEYVGWIDVNSKDQILY